MGTRKVKPKEKYKGFICPLCTDGNERIDRINPAKVVEHLFILVTEEGNHRHYHCHGPLDDRVLIKEMIKFLAKEAGFNVKE